MRKILILSFSLIARDPRVMRQINLLHDKYDLSVAGCGPRPEGWVGTYEEISLPEPYTLMRRLWVAVQMILGLFEAFYWREKHVKQAHALLKDKKFDLVIANDMHALPVAFKLSSACGVVYDAHEYSPLEFSENLKWKVTLGRLNLFFCKKYLKKLSGMTTVCQGIANEYQKNFGVSAGVVYNAPKYQPISPIKSQEDKIRLVHHGVALESRCIELMIEMMSYLGDRFTLDFYLVESKPSYYEKLRELSAPYPQIRFMPPVAMSELPKTINGYDLGVYLLKPVNFNSKFALPNKFFEFVQGRVGIAVGPSPEMAALVKNFEMGVVTSSFEPKELAACLSALTAEQIWQFKVSADKAANDLNYEQAGAVMLAEIERCLS